MFVTITKRQGDNIDIIFSYDSVLVDKVKKLEGRRWNKVDKVDKVWTVLYTKDIISNIKEIFKFYTLNIDSETKK